MGGPLIHLDPQPIHVLLLVFGVFTILFSSSGRFLKERLSLTEPLLATFLGVFCTGVGVLPRLDPSRHELTRGVLLELTRLTIVIQVVTSALELPVGLLRRQAWPLFLLLGPVLALGWGMGTLLAWAAGGMAPLEAALAGACVTATDPVLAHAVVKGSFAEAILPSRLRDLLSAESSANDGFALPFVMLPTLMMRGVRGGRFAAEYLVSVWLYEVLAGVVLGAAIGHVAGAVLRWAERRRLIENDSLYAFSIVLAVSVEGCHRLLGLNEMLGAFAAGVAFTAAVDAAARLAELQIQETTDLLVGNLFFLAFGAALPWDHWFAQGPAGGFAPWRLVLLAVLLLCFKRLPFLLALYRLMPGGLKSLAEATHFGWFGPVGVAAYYYALTTLEDTELPAASGLRVYLAVTWLITVSVGLHGLTGVPVTLLLRRGMVRDDADYGAEEHKVEGPWGAENDNEKDQGGKLGEDEGRQGGAAAHHRAKEQQRHEEQRQQQELQQGDQDRDRDQGGHKSHALWRGGGVHGLMMGRGSEQQGGHGVGGRTAGDVEGTELKPMPRTYSPEPWEGVGSSEARGRPHTVLELGREAGRAAREVEGAVERVEMRVAGALEGPWRPRRQGSLMRAASGREGLRRQQAQQQQG